MAHPADRSSTLDVYRDRIRDSIQREPVVWVAGISLLALFLVHSWFYRFLTDDAFISFRYARNLSEGAGLVFNPGFERVEGYTNFLWVLLLGLFATLGLAPERVANILSIIASVGLFLLVMQVSLRDARSDAQRRPLWILLLPTLLFAATRSIAVWSTSGLETRLFELLLVAGILRAEHETEQARIGARNTWTLSCLLLGLACLTRPDGVLILGGTLVARAILEFRRGILSLGAAARGCAIPFSLVALHLAFRLLYYNDWVPNTYYAKVGGETWWSMGLKYLTAFSIEYGVVFWVPLIAVAIMRAARSPLLASRVVLYAGALVPFILYVLSIGGDHFEYRVLDIVFPCGYLLLAAGAAGLASRGRWASAVAALLVGGVLVSAVAIPALGHAEFPKDYKPGFPGASSRANLSRDLISETRFPILFRTPIVSNMLHLYNDLILEMTSRAVGIRQEEHSRFLPRAVRQGHFVARAVESGLIPRDTHIAIDAIGAIPYTTNLRTLDRLGLTDRTVAKGPPRNPDRRTMAHDRAATIEYAAAREVDFWAPDHTDLVFSAEDPRLLAFSQKEPALGIPLLVAELKPDTVLIAFVPRPERAARLVHLRPALEFFREKAAQPNAPWWTHANLGAQLEARGHRDAARSEYEEALRLNPDAGDVVHLLAALSLTEGDSLRAIEHLFREVSLKPDDTRRRLDLAQGLSLASRYREAEVVFRDGLKRTPGNISLWLPLARFYLSCPDSALRNVDEAIRIAERLKSATNGQDFSVLESLSIAYAAKGDFARAREAAIQAAALARSADDEERAKAMIERASRYERESSP